MWFLTDPTTSLYLFFNENGANRKFKIFKKMIWLKNIPQPSTFPSNLNFTLKIKKN